MKKRILLAGAVALMAAAAVTGYTAHSKTGMVDLLSANVEALAHDESADCTFNTVKKNEDKNTLVCRGIGHLCCKL